MQCDFSKFTDSMFTHSMDTPYLVKKTWIYMKLICGTIFQKLQEFSDKRMSKTENFQNFW